MAVSADDAAFMDRFDGLYVGMLDADELETFADLCRRGLLCRSYAHAGGLLGLARIERAPIPRSRQPSREGGIAMKREADFRLNLVKNEPVIRDARWEIAITNIGDFGFDGKLCVAHRRRGTWDEWPDAESDARSPVTARAYDLEHEVTFPTLSKAMAAAKSFLRKFGAGEVEWLEWDVDGQRLVVVQHTPRDRLGWDDQPDPVPVATSTLTPGA